MPTMPSVPRPSSRTAGLGHPGRIALAALALLWVTSAAMPAPAHARKPKQVYYFVVSEVKLTKGIPNKIGELVRKQLTEAIIAHERLIEALPADAPDPQGNAKAFKKYIKKRKIKPFRVNVEILEYSHGVEEGPRGGQQLVVSISLRTFGETIPQRVMAFSGSGSATIKMEIGRKLRQRDSEVATRDASEVAIEEALAVSLRRLETPPPKQKRRQRKK